MARSVVCLWAVGVCGVWGCEQNPPAGRLKGEAPMIDVTRTAFDPPPIVDGWPGMALFDYDNDGDIDIFVANSTGVPNMFYQNDGTGKFSFAARGAGLAFDEESCITTGVGDFDNDGWLDLIVSRQASFFGPPAPNNSLLYLKNLGPDADGVVRFEDVTSRTGLDAVTFGMSIGVGDLDNDGLLDLYIGRYNLDDLGFALISYLPDTPNVLLRNTGVVDGVPVFEDITESAGVAGTRVAGLAPDTAQFVNRMPTWAVYLSDVNEDGLLDIFSLQEIPGGVDLFMNNGDLTFSPAQPELLNKHGGWMGATAGDFDRDGHLEYFLANVGADANGPTQPNHIARAWERENGTPFHRLLKRDATGMLVDIAADTAVVPGVFPPTNLLGAEGLAGYEFSFGCAWFDMQNDGFPDLHWTGDIILTGLISEGVFRQDFNGLGRYLANNGDGTFTDQTAERGLFAVDDDEPLDFNFGDQGRALAAIDLNGDGFADICRTNEFLIANPERGFICLFNPAVEEGHWLIVRLEGVQSNRFGIGARVEATTGGGLHVGEVVTTTSAFTAVHPQVHFGLGPYERVESLTVSWPSGAVTTMNNVPADQIMTVREQ